MKYPFIKQEDSKDCAVACLSMIISYYKGYVDMERLRNMTNTSKNGTSAYYIIEASKKLGFESKGLEVTIDNLNNIKLPCIAHVTISNTFDHYIVIYRIDMKKKKIIIADPSSNIKNMTFKEFEKIYNNVIITFNKVKNIPVYKKQESLYKYLLNIFKANRKYSIKIIMLSILITLLAIISSFYFKQLIDNINNINLLIKMFIFFLFISILQIILIYFKNEYLIYLNAKVNYDLTTSTFKKIILLPYFYFKYKPTGDVISRINDLSNIREVTNKIIVTLFIDSLLSIIAAISLFLISNLLFMISIIILILYILIIFIFQKYIENLIEILNENNALINNKMIESITGFETLKGINVENIFINDLNEHYQIYMCNYLKLDKISNLELTIKEFINNVGLLVIIFVGIILVKNNILSLSILITYNTLLLYFLNPIRNIIDLNSYIKKAKSSLRRVQDLEYYKDKQKYIDINNIKQINVKNLNHKFLENYVLKNINLKICNGEKIMIIGRSGSGKSTFLKLLKKYYLSEKSIYMNGIDIDKININSINKNIIYISQNEHLFTDTLYNNLDLKRCIDKNKIKDIVDLCEIEKIMPYHSIIEENGFNISGGEKQKIILGRSLLSNFDFLIIDEGLSQMDLALERKILKRIIEKYKNKTIIYVSHRYDNMDLFKRVIEFDNGMIKKDLKRKDD